MTGIISTILTGFAIAVLMSGLIIGLAFADSPAAVVTGAVFVVLGLFGAWVRLRARFRFPRPRPLTGWRITAAAFMAFACGAGCVFVAFLGSITWSAVLAVLGAALGVRCTVARRIEQVCPHQDCWTDEDREWLEANRVALPEERELER